MIVSQRKNNYQLTMDQEVLITFMIAQKHVIKKLVVNISQLAGKFLDGERRVGGRKLPVPIVRKAGSGVFTVSLN